MPDDYIREAFERKDRRQYPHGWWILPVGCGAFVFIVACVSLVMSVR